jgi:hypothetical protein
LAIVCALFVFQPAKSQIARLVDRPFYGGWRNYESFTLEMSRAPNEAVDLETIVTLQTEVA